MSEIIPSRLKKTVTLREIHWPAVAAVLVENLKMPAPAAEKILESFIRKLTEPFEIHWFVNPIMSTQENSVAAAICETVGADIVVVQIRRTMKLMGLRFVYQTAVDLEPSFRRGDAALGAGRASPVVRLSAGRFVWRLDNCDKTLFASILFSIAAGAAYAILYGLLLYGVSVVALFLVEPGAMTKLATTKLHIGAALLGTLVAGAAVFGKAVKNAVGVIRGRLAHRSKSPPAELPNFDRHAA